MSSGPGGPEMNNWCERCRGIFGDLEGIRSVLVLSDRGYIFQKWGELRLSARSGSCRSCSFLWGQIEKTSPKVEPESMLHVQAYNSGWYSYYGSTFKEESAY